MARWMNRVWELAQRDTRVLDDSPSDDKAVRDLQRLVHQTVRRAGDDLERFKFNTALAALMEYTNSLNQTWERKGISSDGWSEAIEKLLLMMAPMAPHMAEELWERTGHGYSVHGQSWPEWDRALAADEVFTLVVQVNGRLRDRIDLPVSATEDEARSAALESQRVAPHIEGKDIARVIYVPTKLVNIVTG
jgi:leucyl-tRNA synthetase